MEYSQKKLLGTQADTVIQFMTEEQFEKLKSDSMFGVSRMLETSSKNDQYQPSSGRN